MVKSTKLKLLIFALLLGTFGFASNASAAGTELWGPERPTYKWDAPADHPVFNSITDNPQIQDERNFVRIKHAGDAGPHVDSVDIVPGKRYEVYMYYHNNASASLNPSGVGFAQNVKMFAEMPEKLNAGDTALIKGTITWGPVSQEKQSVWDTTQLVANDEVYLRYVPNSMKLYNQGYAKNGVALNGTDLFSEVGTYISHGDPEEDITFLGLIPGCNEFAGYVTFEIQADFAKFYMEKNVKMSDDKNGEWKDTITVAPGDELQFSVKYHNEGTVLQEAVRLQDVLPEGLEYVKGSSYAIPHSEINYEFIKNTTNGYSEFPDGVFDEDGVVVGDFMPKTGFTFYYTVKVADADKFKECTTVLYNKASIVTANGAEFDKAKITVNKDCKTDPTPDPDPEDPDPEDPDPEDPKPDDPKPEDPDPEEPDPEDPKPEEPEPAPDELPVAGPSGIIFGIVVVLGICGSCFYLWKVKRTLNKVDAKADVMPEQPKDNE